LTLGVRVLGCDGVLSYTTYSLDGAPVSVPTTLHLQLTPGYLLDACVSALYTGLGPQTCFVIVALQHTCQAGLAPQLVLAQGYVSNLISVSYPTQSQGYAPTGTPNVPVGIRGALAQSASSSTFTVFWPVGSAANDLALIFVQAAFSINTPATWTARDTRNTGTCFGATFSKVLTGTDISNGSVTVTINGVFDASVAIITFVGSTHWNPNTSFVYDIGHDPASSVTVTTAGAGAPNVGDYGVYFSSERGNSTITFNRGTKQASSTTSANSCCALYTEALTAAGQVTAIASFTSAAGDKYTVLEIIQP
jgi:hypothetical protein